MPIALLRYLPYLIGIGAILGGLYAIHHHGYNKGEVNVQAKWDKEKADNLAAQAKRNADDQAKLRKLEEDRGANLATIDNLSAKLARSDRLRLNCANGKTSTDNTTGNGQLPEELRERQEQALNDYDTVYRLEAERADRLVEECRTINDYLR